MNTSKGNLFSIFSAAALALTVGGTSLSAVARALPTSAGCAIINAIYIPQIYLYNSEGEPENVTASVVYQNPYVLDAYNNVIGVVQENDTITDPDTGVVIGYITS